MEITSEKWATRFLNLAKTVAGWSKDESTKVGAVIVSLEGDPISFGFNGFPRGVQELPERLMRPAKYDFSEHAERNAIYLARSNLEGAVIFVTHFPCSSCTRAIIQTGMSLLVVDKNYKENIGNSSSINTPEFLKQMDNCKIMLKESNVTLIEQFSSNIGVNYG